MKYKYILIVYLLLTFTLSSCTTYENSIDSIDGLYFGYSTYYNKAYAGTYLWDGEFDHMQITVPDTYNEIPVTTLGGYFGTGVPDMFYVEFPESYHVRGMTTIDPIENPQYYAPDYEVITLIFNVHLGINVYEIENIAFDYYFINEEEVYQTLYEVFFYFEVDSNNPYLYSNEGKLYDILTDKLIEGIEYQDSIS